jgi:RNA recognition motif-containing protein
VAARVRRGSAKDTRGTAYVVYEDIYDAKMAVDHLSGFNVANRYLIVLYFNPARQNKKVSAWSAALALRPATRCRVALTALQLRKLAATPARQPAAACVGSMLSKARKLVS